MDRPHPTDEELLARLPVERDAFSEFYRRHAQRVLGFAARRLGDPEEVADAVAMIFVAVAESAAGFQPDRGRAVSWLYGLAANVVAEQRRRGAREARALARLSGRALVEPDDYADLERAIDAAAQPGFRSLWSHVTSNPGFELRECVKGRGGSCAYAAAAVNAGGQAGSKTETRGGGSMDSAW